MPLPTNFQKDYFIQTRREIDTEKRERNQILNFAVLVLGALGFAVVQSGKAQEFLSQPIAFVTELSALVILTSLFWVRWMKLRQIADRWYTLQRLLTPYFSDQATVEYLEEIVLDGFSERRYCKKDFVLCVVLSIPIYGLIFLTLLTTSIHPSWGLIISLAIIVLHVAASKVVLYKELDDPFKRIIRKQGAKGNIVEQVSQTQ